MFINDVMCRRDGIIKAYFRGDITEIIIKNVGYKLVVDATSSFSCTMKLLTFLCFLSVMKGEIVDQKDLECEEHFWEKYFPIEVLRIATPLFRWTRISSKALPYLRNLFRATFLLYIALRSCEFMSGTEARFNIFDFTGAWSLMTSVNKLLVNHDRSSISSEISPTWNGALLISWINSSSTKFL